MVITGTHDGEPWTWNLVRENGTYYHVDLLQCSASGGFQERRDWEMGEYVWDYSMYPGGGMGRENSWPEETETASKK